MVSGAGAGGRRRLVVMVIGRLKFAMKNFTFWCNSGNFFIGDEKFWSIFRENRVRPGFSRISCPNFVTEFEFVKST